MGSSWKNVCMLMILVTFFITILSAPQCKAQQPPNPSIIPSRQLDSLLQDYAFRAFDRPRTGRTYDASPPLNLTGVKIAVIRLRSGSLFRRGVDKYKEFQIPSGVVVQPHVTRLAFVYHNLGKWSSYYYPLPGFTFLTPVIGLLAYNAADLKATDLNELGIVASKSPILINYTGNVKPVPDGLTAQCVWFDLDGLPEFGDLLSTDVCSTYRQGHFSIAVNTTGLLAPAPTPGGGGGGGGGGGKRRHKSRVWKIVVGVIGGFVVLVLLALLLAWMLSYRRKKKVAEMERRAELGEALQMARVGMTKAPVASGTRTQPVLENEYTV